MFQCIICVLFCYVNIFNKNNILIDYFPNEIFNNNRSNDIDNILLNKVISRSREELSKLVKAVKMLEDKVERQEHLTITNDIHTVQTDSKKSFDDVGNLDRLQKTIYRLLNHVENQENQIRNSLNDIRQTIDDFELSKLCNSNDIHEISGPSFRSNFNTASLPYRWWNRSMPCLPLLEHRKYSSGSQDSLTESFQVCYFTPKKKKSLSRKLNTQNSGYCIWLPHNKTGEVCCFRV